MNLFNLNHYGGKSIKKTKKKKKYKQHLCSPKKNKYTLKFSCFTPRLMRKLKRLWDKKNPDDKIESNIRDYKAVWLELRKKIKHCDNEACWLKHECIKNNIPEYHWKKLFAPKKPASWKSKPNEWLDTFNIRDVMKQWEKKYDNFFFIGPSPIDYDTITGGSCVEDELCNFNLKETIEKGITKVGIIFNLDKHNQGGSHWVTVFLNIKKKKIYYFDSYAKNIPPQIWKFVKTVKKQGKKEGLDIKYKKIKLRHQYGESECGMYGLYFIITLLKNKPVSLFERKIIKDEEMLELRNAYFND